MQIDLTMDEILVLRYLVTEELMKRPNDLVPEYWAKLDTLRYKLPIVLTSKVNWTNQA